MSDTNTLQAIENLVGVIQLRNRGTNLAPFDSYTDVQLAEMLIRLAATHLDATHAQLQGIDGSDG